LPKGGYVAGKPDVPPETGAIWRGYYDAAKRALTLYATGQFGMEKLSYKMNTEGWAFRDKRAIRAR
jgi:hypothetical protein